MKKNKLKYILCAIVTVFMIGLAFMPVAFADGPVQIDQNKHLEYLTCGNKKIPAPIAPVTRVAVLMLQIILPLAIILIGSMDFIKAVIASDQEKIKKNQHQFLNRLKAGIIFFFVLTAFKFIVSLVADSADSDSVLTCIDCLITDEASCGEIEETNPFIKNEAFYSGKE